MDFRNILYLYYLKSGLLRSRSGHEFKGFPAKKISLSSVINQGLFFFGGKQLELMHVLTLISVKIWLLAYTVPQCKKYVPQYFLFLETFCANITIQYYTWRPLAKFQMSKYLKLNYFILIDSITRLVLHISALLSMKHS